MLFQYIRMDNTALDHEDNHFCLIVISCRSPYTLLNRKLNIFFHSRLNSFYILVCTVITKYKWITVRFPHLSIENDATDKESIYNN